MAQVLRGIHHKIVHRHPHVFGEMDLAESGDVIQNWERIKASERKENGEKKGILDGVPVTLPALAQSFTYQRRVARVGFDWMEIDGVVSKLHEELEELQESSTLNSRQAELGDLLFSVVNLARWYDIDAESALRESNLRFKDRFSYIEEKARAQGRELDSYTLEELDAFWEEAKGGGVDGAS